MSSHEFHLNMIWSGSGSLREMETVVGGGRRGREGGRAGQINTAIFPPSFAPEYDLPPADADADFPPPPLPFPSGFLMGAIADRPISSESKKPLPSFHPSFCVSLALISGRVCQRYCGKRRRGRASERVNGAPSFYRSRRLSSQTKPNPT